ncbi:hypothetical protein HYT23_05650, partial [Candidatus Pacearchaeota archaeon]|nr:hypothetical protein [Candidatus Pacearchaeota archaeon]
RDEGLHPAIRIALRAITDFAIPFQKSSKLYWRYFLVPEAEFTEEAIPQITAPVIEVKKAKNEVPEIKEELQIIKTMPNEPREKIEMVISEPKKEEMLTPAAKEPLIKNPAIEKKEILPEQILDKKALKKEAKKPKPKPKKQKSDKKEEGFFNKVKERLASKSIDITDIIGIKKDELILKVKKEKKEELLIAYNKRKITEGDIIEAHKKAKEADLPYSILNLSGIPKKIQDLIEALKDISSIEKL